MMRKIFIFTMLVSLLGGCTGDQPPTVTPTQPVEQTETAPVPETTAVIDDTFTPALQIPADLNRELEDSEEMQERRDQLVDSFIVPVVEDERVIAAMRAVPRHSFVPLDNLHLAYQDHPLPIGYGQTISQPSLVAMMTELLQLEEGERVLEIGTGSGYQAAILREMTSEVYTVEIIPELTATAYGVLDALGYGDVHVDRRDGYFGWSEHAPYDAIIVTAAPDHLPSPLTEQLVPDGGRMVIPIGPVGDVQTLWLVTRQEDEIEMERILDVRFVPFTRED